MSLMTPDTEKRLIAASHQVRNNAYAPYSKFHVGAAILTGAGNTFVGCNVENASYGMTICAERVAACSAVAAGESNFVAIALSISGAKTPCGACRQFLAEFNPSLPVIIVDPDQPNHIVRTSIEALLPDQFEFDGPGAQS